MKRVFDVPDPITVPDGTELHEVIGPQILSELGLRSNDGVSVAIGKLPAGIASKVHVHPVVWHFTWVRRGTLTVKMKDQGEIEPYELSVPIDHGVLTEAGTFFQLINNSDEPCEVYYIVGPAFVFEMGDEGDVKYNDAVVLNHNWDELAECNWQPPELPFHWKMHQDRMSSLYRTAPKAGLATVNFHRWGLLNGPGSVSVPSPLHNRLLSITDHEDLNDPLEPSNPQKPTESMFEMSSDFINYLDSELGLQIENESFKRRIKSIMREKCNEKPSLFYEYKLAAELYVLAKVYATPDDVWNLLLYGKHESLDSKRITAIQAVRFHVLNDILRYAVTIGGGFRAVGTMENYRGYLGGTYSDSTSYRHYQLK